jgi:hypothetical protein
MTGWNGCVKSGGKLRRIAAMISTPSMNVIARRRRAFLIRAIKTMLHRSESNAKFSRMAEAVLLITADSMADAAQKVVKAVGK